MTPLPASRDAGEGGLIVGWLRRLEETTAGGFRDMQDAITKLRDESVHRREFDRYRDEQVVAFQAALLRHDRDIADVKKQAEDDIKELKEAAQAAKGDRIARVGIAVTAVLCVLGWVLTSYLHYHP